MDVFTMVVAIVAMSLVAGAANNYFRMKRETARRAPSSDLQAELEALRERVRVLEEIVTDDKYRLNAEIRRLERQG